VRPCVFVWRGCVRHTRPTPGHDRAHMHTYERAHTGGAGARASQEGGPTQKHSHAHTKTRVRCTDATSTRALFPPSTTPPSTRSPAQARTQRHASCSHHGSQTQEASAAAVAAAAARAKSGDETLKQRLRYPYRHASVHARTRSSRHTASAVMRREPRAYSRLHVHACARTHAHSPPRTHTQATRMFTLKSECIRTCRKLCT
jgi:hypothetical protein